MGNLIQTCTTGLNKGVKMARERFFNTEGPVNCEDHYCLPPLERINLSEILGFIDQKKYFVLHAPRQTGKTSCLLSLMDHINRQGTFTCLYMNVETGQSAREDVARGMQAIVGDLASRARDFLHDTFPVEHMSEFLDQWGGDSAFNELLSQWTARLEKGLVLFSDEVDSLIGDTLISLLRQIRSGYDKRPQLFPQSIILCGVRDVRDYRIHSAKEKSVITGGSAFNIKAKSLRLGDFKREDMEVLYHQHSDETGQVFAPGALSLAWDLTQGQPRGRLLITCRPAETGLDGPREVPLAGLARHDALYLLRGACTRKRTASPSRRYAWCETRWCTPTATPRTSGLGPRCSSPR
jgi:hypothetical protein